MLSSIFYLFTMILNTMNLEQNFFSLCRQIKQACRHCKKNDRDGNDKPVRLLAVSKKKPVEMIRQLYLLGQRDFGENYMQEALPKIDQLSNMAEINWHLTGPLQTNKTRQAAQYFQWVHTIDREKIALRLNEQRPVSMAPLNVCIQVNISRQDSKSGINPEQVTAMAEYIVSLSGLQLRGLMTVPAAVDMSCEKEVQRLRGEYQSMYTLYKTLQQGLPQQRIDTLSMGMSQDMTLAIEEGSTCVRIGTALFGIRS